MVWQGGALLGGRYPCEPTGSAPSGLIAAQNWHTSVTKLAHSVTHV